MSAPRHDHDDPELEKLRAQEQELARQIEELKKAPEKIQREREERAATLPPLDDLADRQRRRDFEEKASRGQVRNERRAQRSSLFLTFLLIAAVALLASWLFKMLKG
jgi:hypothetical protein